MTEVDPQEEADAAFENSDSQSFRGQHLNAFSFRRQRAAAALGLRYGTGKLSPADFHSHPNPTAGQPEIVVYDGMGEDAAVVVYVCSLPDRDVKQVRRNPAVWEDRFDDWAEKNGLGIDGPNVTEAIGCFAEIVAGLSASRSEPILPTAKGEDDDSPNG